MARYGRGVLVHLYLEVWAEAPDTTTVDRVTMGLVDEFLDARGVALKVTYTEVIHLLDPAADPMRNGVVARPARRTYRPE